MAMTRTQLRRQAEIARYQAGKNKPLERRRVQAFMEPITRAMNQILAGEVDVMVVDGKEIPVTRLNHLDDWAAFDECLNGFIAAMTRAIPDVDLDPLRWVSSDLRNGKLMSQKKAVIARLKLREIEDRLTKCSWIELTGAVRDTQIEIELECLGLKEAA